MFKELYGLSLWVEWTSRVGDKSVCEGPRVVKLPLMDKETFVVLGAEGYAKKATALNRKIATSHKARNLQLKSLGTQIGAHAQMLNHTNTI